MLTVRHYSAKITWMHRHLLFSKNNLRVPHQRVHLFTKVSESGNGNRWTRHPRSVHPSQWSCFHYVDQLVDLQRRESMYQDLSVLQTSRRGAADEMNGTDVMETVGAVLPLHVDRPRHLDTTTPSRFVSVRVVHVTGYTWPLDWVHIGTLCRKTGKTGFVRYDSLPRR